MSRLQILLVLALASLLAVPCFGYTIYLKDGSSIAAKRPYEERDGKAYFTYPNGNQGFLKMEVIDVEKTKQRNQDDIGGASVVQDAEIVEKPPPPEIQKRTLSDMIRERKEQSTGREAAGSATADTASATDTASSGPAAPPKTGAGYPDFTDLQRIQLRDLDLAAEIFRAFSSQSVERVRIYQGTRPTYPLVTVTANSEGSVLRAVAVAAKALGQVRELAPNRVEAFELLITTPTGQRAGQFVITPEDAEELLSGRTAPTAFYVKNVQF